MDILDLYTKDRIKTGKTYVRGTKKPDGYYAMVIHVAIINSDNQMLIQQRQPFKKGWPNMWDITVGGGSISGETSNESAERELSEELGISISLRDRRPSLTVNYDGGFDDIYIIKKDLDINKLTLQYEEVNKVKWASLQEILDMIDNGSFIPYHKSLIELIFEMKDKYGSHMREE